MNSLKEKPTVDGWRPYPARPVAALFNPGRAEPELGDELVEAGVPENALKDVLEVIDRREGFRGIMRAGEALRNIIGHMPNSRQKFSLSRALGIAIETSLEEHARLAGCTKQSVWEGQERLAAIIKDLRLTS